MNINTYTYTHTHAQKAKKKNERETHKSHRMDPPMDGANSVTNGGNEGGEVFATVVLLLAVGAAWGGTNPVLKRGAEISAARRAGGARGVGFPSVLGEWDHHLTTWQYILPWLINLSGSALFLTALSFTGSSFLRVFFVHFCKY